MNNVYGGYQPAQITLEDAFSNEFNNILNAMVRGGHISQIDGQNAMTHFMNSRQWIANNMRNRYNGMRIGQEHILNEAQMLVRDYFTRQQPYQNQPNQFGQPQFNQMPMQNQALQQFQNQQPLNSFAFQQQQPMQQNIPGSYLDRNQPAGQPMNQPNQPNQSIPQNQQACKSTVQYIDKSSIHAEDAQNVAQTTDPHRNYNRQDDHDYLQYSTTSQHSGNIVDVTSKSVIIDQNTGEQCDYITVDCRIPEPCVGYVVDKFLDSNPRLTKGQKYIIDINYRTFVLKRHKHVNNPNLIPVDIFDNQSMSNVDTIYKFISAINDLPKNNASVLEKLIIHEFNDLSTRRLAISGAIYPSLRVDSFDDIIDLFDFSKTRNIACAQHNMFQTEVFKLFRAAIKRIITKDTQFGYYLPCQIAPELLASPKFVIRDNGLYEREADFTTDDMINAIGLRYTAFGIENNITVMNFVPGELDLDLYHTKVMTFGKSCDSNQLIYLINQVWNHAPKTVLVRTNDTDLVIKNGLTMDDVPFLFKEKYEPYYGL